MERHQVALYLGSMIVGAACAGLNGWSHASEQLVPYALGALLWSNFALMPLAGMNVGQHKMLVRTVVLAATLGTPILVAPLVSLFIPEGGPIALATVIVLLAPCVDYVVVFACIAGGEYRGLLATTPYLLGTQIVSIPFWTSAYAYIGILDIGVVGEIFPLPTESYLSLAPLIVPLIAAYLVQRWSTRSPQRQQAYERVRSMSDAAMIPLMCLLLALMCSAYTPAVLNQAQLIPRLAGLYLTYAILAGGTAWCLSKVMSRPERISVTFSAVTRNALIIYPVVALCAQRLAHNGNPEASLMGATVLTQTLTELLIMVAMTAIFRARTKTGNAEAL
ncbi:hypothetical protein [Rothia mucilaginosa]|uniref:hypothetical protein n=1 Tax=Rothia mucilaginosa TaxID=43675 RepID=UPI003C7E99F0